MMYRQCNSVGRWKSCWGGGAVGMDRVNVKKLKKREEDRSDLN